MSNTPHNRAKVAASHDPGASSKAQATGADNARPEPGHDIIRDGLPTGEDTSDRNDVADPHPSTEENYDTIPHPGGANPPTGPDIGPNSYAHDGTAPPRPRNRGPARQ